MSSQDELGTRLGPIDTRLGAAPERGEQIVGIELPQREGVGRIEELPEEHRAEQRALSEHLSPGVPAPSHERLERVFCQRHAPFLTVAGLIGRLSDVDRRSPRHLLSIYVGERCTL